MRLINLDTTTKVVTVRLGEAHTTNALQWTSHYYDSLTANIEEQESNGATNGTSSVTIVAAPGAGERRVVKDISVYNADTVPHTLYLCLVDVSTEYVIRAYNIPVAATRTLDPPVEVEGDNLWEEDGVSTIKPKDDKTVDGSHLSGTIDCGIFQP